MPGTDDDDGAAVVPDAVAGGAAADGTALPLGVAPDTLVAEGGEIADVEDGAVPVGCQPGGTPAVEFR